MLAEIVGDNAAQTEYTYYAYLIDLASFHHSTNLIIKFSLLAIDAAAESQTGQDSENTDALRDLWYKCFRAYVSAEDFDQAYAVMARMPFRET